MDGGLKFTTYYFAFYLDLIHPHKFVNESYRPEGFRLYTPAPDSCNASSFIYPFVYTNFRFEPSHSLKIFVFLRIIVLLLLFTDGTNRTTRSASLYRLHRFAFICTHNCSEFPLNGLLWSTWAFPPLILIKIVMLKGFHICNVCSCYCYTISGNWDRLSLQKSIPLFIFLYSIDSSIRLVKLKSSCLYVRINICVFLYFLIIPKSIR